VLGRRKSDPLFARVLLAAGAGGLAYLLLQAFAIGLRGWEFAFLEAIFGPLETRQFGLGYGALLVGAALLFFLTQGLAARGAVKGDVFVVSSIGAIIALVGVFVFFPVLNILTSAVRAADGSFAPGAFVYRFIDRKIWGLDCLYGAFSCGVAWNSLLLALLTAFSTTILGLAFRAHRDAHEFPHEAIAAHPHGAAHHHPALRHRARHHPAVRRAGAVTQFLADLRHPASRWIYGLPASGSRRPWPSRRSPSS
jgi:iron(III) transport system permease protein